MHLLRIYHFITEICQEWRYTKSEKSVSGEFIIWVPFYALEDLYKLKFIDLDDGGPSVNLQHDCVAIDIADDLERNGLDPKELAELRGWDEEN
jgi:hypothetical protein